jgi:transcription-repair coupling factor (superfamily II helicase)
LGESSSDSEINELFSEIKDRFGNPPTPVVWLYHMNKIRLFATNHSFISVKFGSLSFTAERQKGKEIEKKTILLPKKMQTPESLESYVIEQLIKNFPDDSKNR